MKWLLSLLILNLTFLAFSQTKDSLGTTTDSVEITVPPYWSSCIEESDSLRMICSEEAVLDFILEHIQVPSSLNESSIVNVSFDINKSGEITNIQPLNTTNEEVHLEIKRLLLSMPKWSPGYNKDRVIKVRYTIPVPFIVP